MHCQLAEVITAYMRLASSPVSQTLLLLLTDSESDTLSMWLVSSAWHSGKKTNVHLLRDAWNY